MERAVDVSKSAGDALLDRRVGLAVTGLTAPAYRLVHRRLDETHSNVNAACERISGGRPWPDDEGWAELAETNRLEELEPVRDLTPDGGAIEFTVDLPMPAMSLLELTPTP